MLVATHLLSLLVDQPMSLFTRDFQVTAELPWYTGLLSVFNNMIGNHLLEDGS